MSRHRLIRGKKQTDKLQVKMKRSTQASLTDMFNKMSEVSKPTCPESSEEMQRVQDRQDQVAITSSSIQFETSKGTPAKKVWGYMVIPI